MSNKNLSIKQSFYWIFFSTLVISGSAYALVFGLQNYRLQKLKDQNLKLVAIVQTGPIKNALPTQYLAEKMKLSIDQPTNYYAFDEKTAEERLLTSPYIKTAKVKKLRPNAVYVDYVRREPIAYLADYENTGVDEEGYIFLISPFYEEKKLPEVFLGLPNFYEPSDEQGREGGMFERPLKCMHFQLVRKILSLINDNKFSERFCIKKIDVSKTFSESHGQKEIVLTIEEIMNISQNGMQATFIFPKYLRLNVKEYRQQLANFLVLSQKMRNDYKKQIVLSKQTPEIVRCKPKLLDFRIPQLAFIKENE